jgi:hypothetical protein
MSFKDYPIGSHWANESGLIYELILNGEITDFRDGHPFIYPSCTLRELNGKKTITVPCANMESILFRTVLPKLPDDHQEMLKSSLELFSKALDMASEGKYTSNKEMQYKIEVAAENLSSSYLDLTFRGDDSGYCHEQTMDFLKSYTKYIIIHLEVLKSIKKDDKSA